MNEKKIDLILKNQITIMRNTLYGGELFKEALEKRISETENILFFEEESTLPEKTKEALLEIEIPVHLNHCFQGEYKTTCKYLQDDLCPANPKNIAQYRNKFGKRKR